MARKSPRHTWHFNIVGSSQKQEVLSRVLNGRVPVVLGLTEEYVRRALDQDGQGNTQLCAGTVCTSEHRSLFPHPVVGYTDWQDTVVFVASKLKRGWPSECFRYSHRDKIAKQFDTASGCRRLIARIRQAGGTLVIRLMPYKPYKQTQPVRPRGRRTGARSQSTSQLYGANLRSARVERGLAPPV
jgi:hypothetical protein